jgi:tetratricopeptide (TPR) repeat protein
MHKFYKASLLGFLYFCGLACAGLAGAQVSGQAQIEEGIRLHGQRNFDGAIQIYQRVLQAEPTNVLAMYEMAFSNFAKGDCKTSIEVASRGVEATSSPAYKSKFLVLVGSCEDRLGKPEVGVATLKKAAELDGSNFLTHFNLAVTYGRLKNYDAAIGSLQSAIAVQPGHASSHLLLSQVFQLQGKPMPSMLALIRYLSLEPTGARAAAELPRMDALFASQVRPSVDGKTQIVVSPKTMQGAPVWAVLELGLALSEANPPKTETATADIGERRAGKLRGLLELIGEQARLSPPTDDPILKLYFPFFASLSDKKLEQPMAYRLLLASGSEGVRNWLVANPAENATVTQWLRTQAQVAAMPTQN